MLMCMIIFLSMLILMFVNAYVNVYDGILPFDVHFTTTLTLREVFSVYVRFKNKDMFLTFYLTNNICMLQMLQLFTKKQNLHYNIKAKWCALIQRHFKLSKNKLHGNNSICFLDYVDYCYFFIITFLLNYYIYYFFS